MSLASRKGPENVSTVREKKKKKKNPGSGMAKVAVLSKRLIYVSFISFRC